MPRSFVKKLLLVSTLFLMVFVAVSAAKFVLAGKLVGLLRESYPINEVESVEPIKPVKLDENTIEKLINEYRLENGLNTLEKRDSLCTYAKQRLEETYTGEWNHDKFNVNEEGHIMCSDSLIYCRHMGENLAKEYYTEEDVLVGWKNSLPHNDNLMGDYTYQCVVTNEYGYVVSLFAKAEPLK